MLILLRFYDPVHDEKVENHCFWELNNFICLYIRLLLTISRSILGSESAKILKPICDTFHTKNRAK